MTDDKYLEMRAERDALVESIIHFIGEENRLLVERLITLTCFLDRAKRTETEETH